MPGRITGRVCKSQIDGLRRKALQAEDLKLLTTEEEWLKYELTTLKTPEMREFGLLVIHFPKRLERMGQEGQVFRREVLNDPLVLGHVDCRVGN